MSINTDIFDNRPDPFESIMLSERISPTLIDAAGKTRPKIPFLWDLFCVCIRGERGRIEHARQFAVAVALNANWGRKKLADDLIALGTWLALYQVANPADRLPVQQIARDSGYSEKAVQKVYEGMYLWLRMELMIYTQELRVNVARTLVRERTAA